MRKPQIDDIFETLKDRKICDGDVIELKCMNLRRMFFTDYDLQNVSFAASDLEGASFRRCILKFSDFKDANLHNVSFIGCDLRSAQFKRAELEGVSFRGCWLDDADFAEAKHVPYLPMVCPETGEFEAWKKCFTKAYEPVIVRLLIPADAKRSSSTGRKCRASKAKVLDITDYDGKRVRNAYSAHDPHFEYVKGRVVSPRWEFDENRWEECANGIHFFMTRKEAEDYLSH
ncbi:MAG: pentapeptide repeat-containing protein [Bacteroidaceae bacterium]|nr:pentapeptide repeat-containing protein [Bacteroidaceae bacterium]